MIDLKSLLKGTPHESAPLSSPPKSEERIEILEAALAEALEILFGGEE